jgi:hypothetical protein
MPNYTLELGDTADALLETLATKKGTTRGEILRRALSTYAYLDDEVCGSGLNVALNNSHDQIIKNVQLP